MAFHLVRRSWIPFSGASNEQRHTAQWGLPDVREAGMTGDFWLRIALGALIIIGVWNAFGKDQILGPLGDWMEDRLPEKVLKPIFLCILCMPSVWGSAVWFLTGGDGFYWPFYVIALSGLMKLIPVSLLEK